MADVVTLGDVSTKDTGSGSELKTGGRRKHNMPKKCVEMKMKGGMSRSAAVKACYPTGFPAGSKAEKERQGRKTGTPKRGKMLDQVSKGVKIIGKRLARRSKKMRDRKGY